MAVSLEKYGAPSTRLFQKAAHALRPPPTSWPPRPRGEVAPAASATEEEEGESGCSDDPEERGKSGEADSALASNFASSIQCR